MQKARKPEQVQPLILSSLRNPVGGGHLIMTHHFRILLKKVNPLVNYCPPCLRLQIIHFRRKND